MSSPPPPELDSRAGTVSPEPALRPISGSVPATMAVPVVPAGGRAGSTTDVLPLVPPEPPGMPLSPDAPLPSVLRKDSRPRRPRSRPPWLIAAVAAVVLVVGGVLIGVALGSRGGHSGPSQAQGVVGMAALLDRSSRARSSVTSVINGVESCQMDPHAGLTQLGQAVQVRQQALADLRTTNAPTQLTTALRDALQLSLDADRRFQSWMSFVVLNGCKGRAAHNADFSAGNATSTQASMAKQRFVDLWNLVAAGNGLKPYHAADF
jgi:hypothetical protein